MKINHIVETSAGATASGSVASVSKPFTKVQERTQVSGLEPAEKVMKGKAKKKGPYANSISESKVKELQYALKTLSDVDFVKAYGKGKDFFTKSLGSSTTPAKVPPAAQPKKVGSKVWHDTGYTDKNAARTADASINEEELSEQDLIIVPGMRRMKDTSFIPHKEDRRDHEVEMARSDLFAAAKDAMRIFRILENVSEEQGIMGWQQSYITLAADYLNSVADSLEYEAMTNENVLGNVAKTLAKQSLKDLPRTPEVDRAIANRAMRYARNMNDTALYGIGLGTGAMANQIYHDQQNKPNPADQLQPVQVTGKRVPQGKVTVEPMPNTGKQPKFPSMPKTSPDPLKPQRGINKPGLRTASVDTDTDMIEGVIAGGMSNFEEDVVNELSPKTLNTFIDKLSTAVRQGRPEPTKINPLTNKVATPSWKVAAGKVYPDKELGKYAKVKAVDPTQTKQLTPESQLDEKKDACYSKVKSRYKVWPSAYASGALSKCRKVGASNWGNKSKK